ncbi:MAG: FKBP-type peptidyl-prolyl cis-trans isomerase [Lachnospiraceae bacterium]|nr:FKBP-type peptidyl-prolyl cis-trans isomerase [Lachnospiraceae bacterium]
MKRKIMAVLLASLMVFTTAACGNNAAAPAKEETESETTESTEESASEVQSFPADEANTSSDEMTADNVDEFIKLGEYKGIKLDAGPDTVIENGMTANIDFAGSIDGDYFDGGTAEGYDLVIGSGSFIDNFEEQLIGHKAGDQVDVNVTFPEDYGQEDLAGKKALFEVTVNSVAYQSVDSAFAELVSTSEVLKYPQSLIDTWKQSYIDQYGSYVDNQSDEEGEETADAEDTADSEETADTEETADSEETADTEDAAASEEESGKTDSPDEKLAEIAALFGMTEETLNEMILSNVKYCMVSQAILAKENITRDSEYYQNALKTLLGNYGYSSVDDALAAGIPESQFYYSADATVAMQVIQDNQA